VGQQAKTAAHYSGMKRICRSFTVIQGEKSDFFALFSPGAG